jgi:uncharacterized protein YndB with AHSA1/START domain
MLAEMTHMARPPLVFTFYIAAPIEKVWDGFVSKEANRTIFMGAEYAVDLRPGGAMTWSGPGKDGRPTRYVTGEVITVQAPTLLEYKFGMGEGAVMSHVRIELTPESEAVKVIVSNDGWSDDDPTYSQNADGWPRILSRLKTLLETGKTFKPH